jgi:hypothetical protein
MCSLSCCIIDRNICWYFNSENVGAGLALPFMMRHRNLSCVLKKASRATARVALTLGQVKDYFFDPFKATRRVCTQVQRNFLNVFIELLLIIILDKLIL